MSAILLPTSTTLALRASPCGETYLSAFLRTNAATHPSDALNCSMVFFSSFNLLFCGQKWRSINAFIWRTELITGIRADLSMVIKSITFSSIGGSRDARNALLFSEVKEVRDISRICDFCPLIDLTVRSQQPHSFMIEGPCIPCASLFSIFSFSAREKQAHLFMLRCDCVGAPALHSSKTEKICAVCRKCWSVYSWALSAAST